jgi:hypothetical protein
MINQIAMFTAVIATVGAIFAYMGGATQANAGLYKNNAAIKKTEASNQWNYFQAKSTKQSLAEISRDLAPADKQGQPTRPRSTATRRRRRRSSRTPQDRGGVQGLGQAERRADAPAPPLGPGHHRAAGRHRAGRHRAAHAQEVAGVGHVRHGRRRRGHRRAGVLHI